MKLSMASGWLGMAALAATGALSGCGLGTADTSASGAFDTEAALSGVVHGGQSPVYNATVYLYAAGTAGYGSQPTLLATSATTTTSGGFSFTKGTQGPTSGNAWACPSSTTDDQIYLMSQGGNPQTTDATSTTNNTAITLVAALGPCSKVSGSQFVIVDELSTAAAAFALSAYITPSSTAGGESIGTKGQTFTSTTNGTTPQAAVGFNNAVASIANLKAASTSYAGTTTSVAAVTVTATPEPGKMNLIANILAACVNTISASSAACTTLFNAAIPDATRMNPGTTTLATQPKAADIFQAAYYMATNPTDAGTQTSCSGGTTNIACLFNLPTAGAPFQTALATQPTDWTIGVTYTATGGCSNNGFGGALFFDAPTKEAVDANGNIYVMNGSISKAAIVEMSPVGEPLACVIPALSTGTAQTYGAGLTIDPSGNVWGLYSHSTTTWPNAIVEWAPGATAVTSYATSLPALPAGLATDIDGNIFYTTSATGGTLYEFVVPPMGSIDLTTATPVKAVPEIYSAGSALTVNTLASDSLGRIVVNSASIASLLTNWPLTSSISAVTATGGTVTFTGANTFSAGQTVTISGLTGAGATQFNGQRFVVTGATSTAFTAASTATGSSTGETAASARATGVGTNGTSSGYQQALMAEASSGYGLGIDSTNHYFTGTACCTNGSTGWGVLNKITPNATYAATADSTRGNSAQFLGGLNGTRSLALDGAGRVWMGSYWWESVNSSNVNVYGLQELGAVGTGTSVAFTGYSPAATATCAGTAAAGCAVNGGFQKADVLVTTDIAVDPSGNVWAVGNGVNNATSATGIITPYSGTSQPLGLKVVELVGAATPTVTPLIAATIKGTLATAP